jgi:hypothetical protein
LKNLFESSKINFQRFKENFGALGSQFQKILRTNSRTLGVQFEKPMLELCKASFKALENQFESLKSDFQMFKENFGALRKIFKSFEASTSEL